jgi:hypothetical protein
LLKPSEFLSIKAAGYHIIQVQKSSRLFSDAS